MEMEMELNTRQRRILEQKHDRELREDVRNDELMDLITDPERLRIAYKDFIHPENIQVEYNPLETELHLPEILTQHYGSNI